MSCPALSLAKGAAQTAHAHAAALLVSRQVKLGDKLPLNETVKETDATKPITLAPSGRNIFVRSILLASLPSFPHVFSLSLFQMYYICV